MRTDLGLVLAAAALGCGCSANPLHLLGHDRRIAALEAPLAPAEEDWLNRVFSDAARRAPKRIGEWRLASQSCEFNPTSSSAWKREVFGARLRFEYTDPTGRTAVVYHFINPVRVRYPEWVGFGYYLEFFAYQDRSRLVYGDSEVRVFAGSGWLALNSPMVPDADRELVSRRTTVKVVSYLGHRWVGSERESPNAKGTWFVVLQLGFDEGHWRKEAYGTLCVAALPDDLDYRAFILQYLGIESSRQEQGVDVP